jgi:hypothetical protein
VIAGGELEAFLHDVAFEFIWRMDWPEGNISCPPADRARWGRPPE